MPPRKRKTDDDYNPHGGSYPAYARGVATQNASSGSSSNPIVLDSPPKPKRQRKAKDPSAPVPEKRGATFKKACPKNIIERVERVMSQRFFMIDRRREGDALREEFSVLGSTGNVYTVVIDKKPSCNCPDALKGNHCKHILFIFLKVLQVTQNSGYWYQKALLTSELEDIFAHAPRAPAAIAHERIRTAYAKATGKEVDAGPSNTKKRMPTEEDACPVCYEDLHGTNEKLLTFCDACGNGLHKQCFQQWMNTTRAKGNDVTCVFCRAMWPMGASAGAARAGGSRSVEGYLNLGDVAGVNTVRDTSSYYHGPTRDHRHYGYQRYEPYC